jgi:hypothetical protein
MEMTVLERHYSMFGTVLQESQEDCTRNCIKQVLYKYSTRTCTVYSVHALEYYGVQYACSLFTGP